MLKGLVRTKSLDDILAGIGGPQFALKRTLGAFNVTLLGIGAIIGAGIFATIGTAAAGDAARPGAGPSRSQGCGYWILTLGDWSFHSSAQRHNG